MLRRGRTYSLPGFLRPLCGKLLPALIFLSKQQVKIDNLNESVMNTASRYPGFEYSAKELSKFLSASDFFTIMLTSGEIIHYTPLDENSFRQWLLQHNVKDLRAEIGWVTNSEK